MRGEGIFSNCIGLFLGRLVWKGRDNVFIVSSLSFDWEKNIIV